MTLPTPIARSAPSLLLLTSVLAACGDGGGGDDSGAVATVDTVGGVEVLSYPEASAGALGWGMDTLAVLGDAFAEDEYQFGMVSRDRLAADDAGNLYVLDMQGARLLKYDARGQHLRTFGRKGEGPGELSQPLGLAVGPGDTAWVSDFANSRLTGYPTSGGEPRVVPFPENGGIPSSRMAALDDAFLMIFRPMFNFRQGSGGELEMSRGDGSVANRPTLPLLRMDRSLAPLDTLWRTPEPPLDLVQIESGDRMTMVMLSREFWPEFRWDSFNDGGVVISDSSGYVLHFLSPDGDVERTVTRAPAARTATEQDRERVRQRLREESGGVRIGGGSDEEMQERILQQRLEKMTFAEVIPRIVRLAVDPQDRVWVGVSEDVPDEVARVDVYDRQGRLLGELRDVPAPDVFLGAGRVGVLRQNELDVQQVVLLELSEEPLDG